MKMYKVIRSVFLLANLLTILSLEAACKYDLSVCMIFKDEAPYLQEWIEFHRLVGVQHFYLYNNHSSDNYQEVLKPYVDDGVVELVDWGHEASNLNEWDAMQVAAYDDAIVKCRGITKWLAVIDCDEFLFPTNEDNLTTFLKKYERKKGLGGILVNWVVHGTSGVEKIPKDKLLIETLVLGVSSGSEHFKTICRPKRVSSVCTPHHMNYKPGYHHCTPSGYQYPAIEIDRIRINHYWARDEWYLENVKIPRRAIIGTDAETCRTWAHASNQEYDSCILRFVEQLKQRMNLCH